MKTTSLETLCDHLSTGTTMGLSALLPSNIQEEVGQFNVFNMADLTPSARVKPAETYECRAYYKISLINGRSRVEYPDKTIDVERPTLVFTTPKSPFYWQPLSDQTGQFCVFTNEFLLPTKSGVVLEDLPVFKTCAHPVFQLSYVQCIKVQAIFQKMQEDMASDYAYKYGLLRNYTLELIHFAQKLQPASLLHPAHNASARVASLFIELLERQFPLETPQQQLRLRTAKDFADHLAVHVNHLNKVLKETTGLTTTDLIGGRIVQEAKILLRQTNWTLAEVADSLGFTDVAHFSNFFKRQTAFAPGAFRVQE